MDLLMLIWLFPVVLIFHDFEEIMMMEKWVKRNSSTITDKLPPRIARRVIRQFSLSTAQFAVAVLLARWIEKNGLNLRGVPYEL
jgi:hypothetical protein